MATRARHFEAALAGFRNNSGVSLSGGKLQFYVSGTSTPKNAYTDREKTQPVTEVTLDANGRAEVFGDGWYDIKLIDTDDSVLDTFEYVYLQRASFTVETKTESFTATTDVDVYLVDTTNGNVVVSYPAAADIEYPIEVAKKTSDANTVTIDPYGTETVNGEASFVLDAPNQSVMVASDGANLFTLGAFVNTAVTITTEATTAVKGKMRFATSSETIAGTEADAATTPASVMAAYGRLFKGYHEGLVISTGTDASHDIDISAGICRDSENASFIQLSSALTKQIDADWAEGTNAGGFPSGITLRSDVVARQNSTAYGLGAVIDPGFGSYWWECTNAGTTTTSAPSAYGEGGLVVSDGSATFTAVEKVFYRVFLIRDADAGTVDAGFDTSATAANLLADATYYTEYRQIGWVLENGTGGIRAFWHVGDDYFLWDAPIENINYSTTMPTSQTAVKITTPPDTVASIKVGIELSDGSGAVYGLIYDSRQADVLPSTTSWNMSMARASSEWLRAMCSYEILTDSNSQIQVRFSGAQKYGVSTVGYKYLWG